MPKLTWYQRSRELGAITYTCGYCGAGVGASEGYFTEENHAYHIIICPFCSRPTYFEPDGGRYPGQHPGVAYGSELEHLPGDVGRLYDEARNAMAVNASTAAVMVCRKLLMNIAVAEGADPGKKFAYYVKWLADNGYVPKKGHAWVDRIREKGNEANHEIPEIGAQDAKDVLLFTEMLLNVNYELPALADEESDNAEEGEDTAET